MNGNELEKHHGWEKKKSNNNMYRLQYLSYWVHKTNYPDKMATDAFKSITPRGRGGALLILNGYKCKAETSEPKGTRAFGESKEKKKCCIGWLQVSMSQSCINIFLNFVAFQWKKFQIWGKNRFSLWKIWI